MSTFHKQKVLYIVPTSEIGGAETFVKMTTSHANYEPHYFLFQKGPLQNWLMQNGNNVFILRSQPHLKNIYDLWQTHQQICNYIKKNKIALVHSTMAYAAIFAAMACFRTKTKHIWFQHGPAAGKMDQLAALMPNNLVLCNSGHTLNSQNKLEQKIPFFKKTNKLILPLASLFEIPSDNEKNQARELIRTQFALQQDSLIISMFCRFQRWKGVHLLAEAVLPIKDQIPKNTRFIIWGDSFKQDSYKKDMESYCQKNKLPFIFPGSTDTPEVAMRACDLIVNASLTPEPFGLSVVESMSQKTAVLAPRAGGPKEIIEDGISGVLFDPGSAKDLSLKLLALIHTPEQLNRIGVRGSQEFQKKYTKKIMLSKLESIYERVLKD